MRKIALLFAVIGLALPAMAPAYGQATRTWVSGTGLDTNPCSRTAPCLTFAFALTQTAAGGEINVLDPGGFGNLSINKSISIYNDGAGEAGIITSGVNGIVINAGVNDVINLRGLTLNGQGGNLGVHVLSAGRLSIQNCVIQQYGTGVNIATSVNIKVKIQDSTIINNTNGVSSQPGAATTNVAIDRSRIDSNSGIGVLANGAFGGSSFLTMSDSSASFNAITGVTVRGNAGFGVASLKNVTITGSTGDGVLLDGTNSFANITESVISGNGGSAVRVSAGASEANVDHTTMANNFVALNAGASGAIIRSVSNGIFDNTIAFAIAGGATMATDGQNRTGGNGGGSDPNASITLK